MDCARQTACTACWGASHDQILIAVAIYISKSAVDVDASKRGRLQLVLRACRWGGLGFALRRALECDGGLIASQLRQEGGKGAKLRGTFNHSM